MLANFPAALAFVKSAEGNFTNSSADPGGMTNMGITKASWEAYVGAPVTETDMRTITPTQAAVFYRTEYWNKAHCSELPSGLDLCVFDFAVNAGVSRAIQFLQRLVSVTPDGAFGPLTSKMVSKYVADNGIVSAIKAYQDMRRTYYVRLPNAAIFGVGWVRRVNAGTNTALQLAGAVTA